MKNNTHKSNNNVEKNTVLRFDVNKQKSKRKAQKNSRKQSASAFKVCHANRPTPKHF